MWKGAAAICTNEYGQILMVLQGQKHEIKKWSIPSGGLLKGETFEDCCLREVKEETGYDVEIVKKLFAKVTDIVKVQYFAVKVIGGEKSIQDSNGLIYDVQWVSKMQLQDLDLSFPEDRDFLIAYYKHQTMQGFQMGIQPHLK